MNNDLISRERAIKELLDVYEYEYPTASGAFDEFVCQIMPNVLRYIPAVDAGPKWISVKDRLPEDPDTLVLCCVTGKRSNTNFIGAIEIGAYWGVEGWCLEAHPDWENPPITHWMPLPEPPKEG